MQLAKRLDEWENDIMSAKGQAIQGCLVIGRALQAISSGRLWATAADSFAEYVEREHGMKRSWAFALIGVYDKFGQYLITDEALQKTDVTRFTRLLPYTTDENVEELAHAAAGIPGTKDFENYIRGLQGKVATDQCNNHDFEPIPYKQCKSCGLKIKG